MAIFTDRRTRELSRLESILALVIILVVIYFLMGRVEALFARVEKAQLTTTVSRLNASLRIEVAARLMQGNERSLAALEGANPMTLGDPPSQSGDVSTKGHYVGEFSSPDPASIPSGKWYFDSDQGYLIYRVKATDYFETTLTSVERARFEIKLDFFDKNANGRFDAGEDRFRGVSLEAVEPYRWKR